LRELADVAHLGVAANALFVASNTTPYVSASAGAWFGRDSGAAAGQQSGESGPTFVVEAGYRVQRFDIGLAVHDFDGSIRGAVHVVSIVGRARF
jgi:hypothetical protein